MGKIRLYLDESVDIRIAEGLKRRGVEVHTARDTSNLGLSDEEQLEYARKNEFVIFTHDIDFLKLAAQWSKEANHMRALSIPTSRVIPLVSVSGFLSLLQNY